MGKIIIFGAGGRAGRTAAEEAVRRGHQVTLVVRDPAKYPDLANTVAGEAKVPERVDVVGGETKGPELADSVRGAMASAVAADGSDGGQEDPGSVGKGDGGSGWVDVVAGDIRDGEAVSRLVVGHDAVINAAVDLTPPYEAFFTGAARALVEAGVGRLVVVGLASILENESGELLMDTPGYPQEYRSFYLGHEAGMDVLRQAPAEVDWVVLSPSGDFDHTGASTGAYRLAPGRADSRVTYADFARAVLDEIDTPTHHRTHLGVEESPSRPA